MEQWLARWTCDSRSLVRSQQLHCQVRPWESRSHASPRNSRPTIWYQRKLGSKQGHRATHWSRVHGLAPSAGVWLSAIESEISATLWATMVRALYFTSNPPAIRNNEIRCEETYIFLDLQCFLHTSHTFLAKRLQPEGDRNHKPFLVL